MMDAFMDLLLQYARYWAANPDGPTFPEGSEFIEIKKRMDQEDEIETRPHPL